ncbi:hypothetical protein ABMA28_001013 [Loxostege sticticalis]|uniref:Uncharacterized protein n=1 Tax=Loxostege sticticalis TaxID=481309 RepID=A0ABD0T4A5_LOXSC
MSVIISLYDIANRKIPRIQLEQPNNRNNKWLDYGAIFEDDDFPDCSVYIPVVHCERTLSTPWKVNSRHTGTRRTHYHFIYVSTAKNWRYNSKLGKAIAAEQHKCSQITCLQCMYDYITTGDNRTTLQGVLSGQDRELFKCAAHIIGIPTRRQTVDKIATAESRDNILQIQGPTRDSDVGGMDRSATDIAENLPEGELSVRGDTN